LYVTESIHSYCDTDDIITEQYEIIKAPLPRNAVDMLDAAVVADMVDLWTCGCGGHSGVADAVDLWMQWTWGRGGLVDAVGRGRDQGPWDVERKNRVFCSHIGSKNTSIF